MAPWCHYVIGEIKWEDSHLPHMALYFSGEKSVKLP